MGITHFALAFCSITFLISFLVGVLSFILYIWIGSPFTEKLLKTCFVLGCSSLLAAMILSYA